MKTPMRPSIRPIMISERAVATVIAQCIYFPELFSRVAPRISIRRVGKKVNFAVGTSAER